MKKSIQTIIDGVSVLGAYLLATWIRFNSGLIPMFHDSPPPRQLYINGAVIGAVIVVLTLHAARTYENRMKGRLIGAGIIGGVLLFAGAFVIRTEPPFSRIVLLLSIAIIPLLLLIERLALSRWMDTSGAEEK